MTGEIPRTQLIEELVSLLRVPDALVGKVAKLPDGWEYGNDVDRALLPVAESKGGNRMSVRLHEYTDDEEFYARFIQIRGPQHSVLVFNYGDGARDLAERIAGLMGDEWSWHEGDSLSWDEQEEDE